MGCSHQQTQPDIRLDLVRARVDMWSSLLRIIDSLGAVVPILSDAASLVASKKHGNSGQPPKKKN